MFERKVLGNIFGPIYNTELGIFERRKNLYRLRVKPYKSQENGMVWACVWRADDDVVRKALTETARKNRPTGRPRTRWKDAAEKDIKMFGRNASVDRASDRGKTERMARGSSGPTGTVKPRKNTDHAGTVHSERRLVKIVADRKICAGRTYRTFFVRSPKYRPSCSFETFCVRSHRTVPRPKLPCRALAVQFA